MVDQIGHQIDSLTASESSTIMVEGAKHHFYRDLFERFIEALGHLLTDIEEHEVKEEGGIEVELDASGRGFPEIGEIQHPFGDQEGIFYAPAPSI